MLSGLKVVQAIHNLALSGFSLACFLGTLYACLTFEWAAPQSQGGLYGAICVEAGEHTTDAVSEGLRTWFLWYQLSKYWEFLDTALLIINRKPVSFLHAYHHTVVAFTSWTWTRAGECHRDHATATASATAVATTTTAIATSSAAIAAATTTTIIQFRCPSSSSAPAACTARKVLAHSLISTHA